MYNWWISGGVQSVLLFRCRWSSVRYGPSVPLNELEEAMLVGAGAGFSGLAFWDLPTPPPYRRRSGRTFPTTRPGGHTALFLTNDEGFYVLEANVAELEPVRHPTELVKPLYQSPWAALLRVKSTRVLGRARTSWEGLARPRAKTDQAQGILII
jgi:hypothetical protein